MNEADRAVDRRPWLIALLAVGLLAWLFRGLLFFGHGFAFRDTADFYDPLFRLVQDQWSAGHVPLWNPYDNLGLPLAASPTASIWYPGKLLFFLPIGFDSAYRIYILAHVLLAAWSSYRLARHWRSSVWGAGLGSLAYAFGGSLLYQHANVVYLIGGAWMPLALLAAERWFAGRRSAILGLAVVLALMVLGGDPQAAYHTLLLIAARRIFFWGDTASDDGTETPPAMTWRSFAGRIGHAGLTCALAGLLAGGLAAIQILPALDFARRSDRAVSAVVRSLWDLPRAVTSHEPWPVADGLLCRNDDPHLKHVYEFSLAPWRLAECVWPNCGGRQFPVHRRWSEILAPDQPVWVPSLYLGLLPVLLALSRLRWRRGPCLDRWLSWMAVLAVVAAFGTYAPGWLIRHLASLVGTQPDLGDPVGGVYWLLTVVLPGYVEFRYPAKWMTVASLMLCLLAARAWDALPCGMPGARGERTTPRLVRWTFGLALASLLGAAVVLAIRPWWAGWMAGLAPDPFFGPLDASGAARDLLGSMLHTAVLALVLGAVLGAMGRLGRAGRAAQTAPICLGLLVLDLAVANGWMVTTAPVPQERSSPVADWIHAQRRSSIVPPRAYRHWLWSPEAWSRSASEDRLAESTAWHRATIAPQHHQTFGIDQAETYGTLVPADLRWLVRAAESGAVQGSPNRSAGWGQTPLAGLLAVEFTILPRTIDAGPCPADSALRENGFDPATGDVAVRAMGATMPRAWIVHHAQVEVPPDPLDAASLLGASRRMLDEIGSIEGARRAALVEMDPSKGEEAPSFSSRGPAEADPEETCRIIQYEPDRVVLEAHLSRPGMVVLAEQYDPGWSLEVQLGQESARPAAILRTDRVLRGVWLPAGNHRLSYRYRPATFTWGAAISVLAWLALLAGAVVISLGPSSLPAGIRRPGRRGCAGSASPARPSCAGRRCG